MKQSFIIFKALISIFYFYILFQYSIGLLIISFDSLIDSSILIGFLSLLINIVIFINILFANLKTIKYSLIAIILAFFNIFIGILSPTASLLTFLITIVLFIVNYFLMNKKTNS